MNLYMLYIMYMLQTINTGPDRPRTAGRTYLMAGVMAHPQTKSTTRIRASQEDATSVYASQRMPWGPRYGSGRRSCGLLPGTIAVPEASQRYRQNSAPL